MYILIERYINNLTINDLNYLALNNNINLSSDELNFSFAFIKKNWKTILGNHGVFDIEKYRSHYTVENFEKIKQLYKELKIKYSNYL